MSVIVAVMMAVFTGEPVVAVTTVASTTVEVAVTTAIPEVTVAEADGKALLQ